MGILLGAGRLREKRAQHSCPGCSAAGGDADIGVLFHLAEARNRLVERANKRLKKFRFPIAFVSILGSLHELLLARYFMTSL
jgi:hypothetical protein